MLNKTYQVHELNHFSLEASPIGPVLHLESLSFARVFKSFNFNIQAQEERELNSIV